MSNERKRILMPVKKPKPLMSSIKDRAYFDGMKDLADEHLALCKNSLGCVRPANGTDGLGLCMHCEDDLMNYLRVKGGPWGGPNGGGVFHSAEQAALSGIDKETYRIWTGQAIERLMQSQMQYLVNNRSLEKSKQISFVRQCGNGSCIRSGHTATGKGETPSWCLPCQEDPDNRLTL
jgi:hypothetical protein